MHSSFDIAWVRSQFPALRNGEIFFDGPGGTQVPQRVVDAISGYLTGSNSNLHGAFRTSHESDVVVDEAHQAAADMLGCTEHEVIFGPNMTTLTFWLSRALACELEAGDEIVVTRLDHDANHAPWVSLEDRGIRVREVPFRPEDCTLPLDTLRSSLGPRTKLVAVGYASNAVGTVNDLETIVGDAHAVGARVFVDAVHFAPHGPIDVAALGCDFLACSAYKFFGPHQGLLFARAEHWERLRAYKVRPAPEEPPGRFETGTQNHECMAGTTAAVDYLAELGRRSTGAASGSRRADVTAAMQAIRSYERDLGTRLIEGLLQIPRVQFYGIRDAARFDWRVPTVGIRVHGMSPAKVARRLGDQGIFVWDGNFYALNVTMDLGLEENGGLVRIGLAHYSTPSEVDRLLEAVAALGPG